MSMQSLDWINAEFLQKILQKSESDKSIEVTDVKTNRATSIGDNYLSDMIRATVEYSRYKSDQRITEKKSVIIKIAPILEEENNKLVAEFEAFPTEVKMMESTLSKMNELLNDKRYRLSANILHADLGELPFLVIEDLGPLGFRMANRQTGLDLEHCILAIRSLARFHGSSVALSEKDPKSMDSYRKGIFNEQTPTGIRKIFDDGMRTVGNQVLTWSELGSSKHSYAEKILKFAETCFDKAVEACRIKDDEFNVLNHGDVWTNNMLFRYSEEGEVTDHIFVDFQVCLWGSPAIDIVRFTSTSVSEDVDMHHCDDLIQEYLKTLTETMSSLSCNTKPPSMPQLKNMLKNSETMEVLWSAVGLPFMLVDKSEAMTLDEIMSQDADFVNPAYKTKAYRTRMLRKLAAWEASGVLDK